MTLPLASMDTATHALADIEQRARLKLSANQRRRLLWIIEHKGVPAIWSSGLPLPGQTDCVIVTDVPSSLESERLLESLSAEAIVILPYSEDPLFDTLKAEFFDHGTVGAAGADGPHQLWWGGRRGESIAHGPARLMPLIVSCYAPSLVNINKVRRLKLSADTLKLSHAISQYDAIALWETGAAAKVQYIWKMWTTTDRPVLWVEPDAMLLGCPSLPIALDCDFAVHKRDNHAFDGSVLYFGRSRAAEILLQTWHKLCLACPGVSDNTLLDRAWSLVSSQRDIDTIWLPRSYCGSRNTRVPGEESLIFRDGKPRLLQNLFGEMLSLVENDTSVPCIAARGYARTGAPEAQLVMPAEAGLHGPVVVLVHDTRSARPSLSSAILETIAAAFAEDSGGFSHLEIVLCRSEADFQASVDAAQDFWVVVTTPAERFGCGTFRTFGNAIHAGNVGGLCPAHDGASNQNDRRDGFPPVRGLTNVKSSETFLTRASALRAASANGALA